MRYAALLLVFTSCCCGIILAAEDAAAPDVSARAAALTPSNTKFNSAISKKPPANAPAGQALTANGSGASVWAFITGTSVNSGTASSGMVLTANGSGGSAWGTTGAPTTFTGTLSGDVTGTQSATVVATVGSVTAANMASGANAANAATNANTPSTIVKRDASGNFAGGTFTGNTAGTHTGTATNVTGIVAIVNGGTGSSTQSFVDLTTPQSIGGTKNFTSNVGIGTSIPSSLLSLNSSNVNGASLTLTSGSFTSSIGQKSFNSPDHALQFSNANATNTDNAFTFLNNSNTTLLAMLANGSVGIGTAKPIISGTGSSPLLQVVAPAAQATVATSRAFAITSNDAYVGVGSSSNPFGLDVRITGAAALGNRAVYVQTTQFDTQDGGNLLLQPTAGNVGIGTTNPGQSLTVVGSASFGGIDNTALGIDAAGTGRLGFIKKSGGGPVIASAAGTPIIFSQTDQVGIFTNIATATLTERMRIDANGNVGIGVSSPGFTLDVNGGIRCVGAVNTTSDARYKTRVETLSGALASVLKLRGVSYNWKREEFPEKKFDDRRQLGFIAQEIHEVLPDVVTADNEGYLSVAYSAVVPVLTEAIKEQQKTIVSMQAKIDALEAKDKARDARLARIEKLLGDGEPHLLPAGFEAK